MPAPSLLLQTTYAELLDRCAATDFQEACAEDGNFIVKNLKGRRYWYFQTPTAEGRTQRYIGPETPELLERIENHQRTRHQDQERQALVSTLTRSFGLPRPLPESGNILMALARAGVFRLRGVLIGTVAYQCYAATLGTKLPIASLQTADIDIAQFKNISVALKDRTPPILEVLKSADSTFRAVPHNHDKRKTTSYAAKNGFRVDFLTPNQGPETDKPQALPSFRTEAQPLRFLDYLIHDPEPAVVLHGPGILVRIPPPERYAIHKLIVSRRRPSGSAKADKDTGQAEALVGILLQKRPYELRAAWNEACDRGHKWRELLLAGTEHLSLKTRESLKKFINL